MKENLNKDGLLFNQNVTTSQYYDLDQASISRDDIEFYVSYIRQMKGEVLELGCGTGLVTIPIARLGVKVTGLDISHNMLSIFDSKLKNLDSSIRDNISLVLGNMTTFSFDRKFECIFIAFRTFQVLTDQKEISQALQHIHAHLKDEGTFIINVFKPLTDMKELEGAEEEKIIKNKEGNKLYRRISINTHVDTLNQILYCNISYQPFNQDKDKELYVEHLKLKYYYEGQLEKTLRQNNFIINAKYGHFDKRSINDDDTKEMIFLCKKR